MYSLANLTWQLLANFLIFSNLFNLHPKFVVYMLLSGKVTGLFLYIRSKPPITS